MSSIKSWNATLWCLPDRENSPTTAAWRTRSKNPTRHNISKQKKWNLCQMSPPAQVHFKILQKPVPKWNQGAKLAPKSNPFFCHSKYSADRIKPNFCKSKYSADQFLPLQLFCEIALSQYNNCSAYLKIGLPMKQLVVSTNNTPRNTKWWIM